MEERPSYLRTQSKIEERKDSRRRQTSGRSGKSIKNSVSDRGAP